MGATIRTRDQRPTGARPPRAQSMAGGAAALVVVGLVSALMVLIPMPKAAPADRQEATTADGAAPTGATSGGAQTTKLTAASTEAQTSRGTATSSGSPGAPGAPAVSSHAGSRSSLEAPPSSSVPKVQVRDGAGAAPVKGDPPRPHGAGPAGPKEDPRPKDVAGRQPVAHGPAAPILSVPEKEPVPTQRPVVAEERLAVPVEALPAPDAATVSAESGSAPAPDPPDVAASDPAAPAGSPVPSAIQPETHVVVEPAPGNVAAPAFPSAPPSETTVPPASSVVPDPAGGPVAAPTGETRPTPPGVPRVRVDAPASSPTTWPVQVVMPPSEVNAASARAEAGTDGSARKVLVLSWGWPAPAPALSVLSATGLDVDRLVTTGIALVLLGGVAVGVSRVRRGAPHPVPASPKPPPQTAPTTAAARRPLASHALVVLAVAVAVVVIRGLALMLGGARRERGPSATSKSRRRRGPLR